MKAEDLRVRESTEKGIYIEGLSEHVIDSVDDILKIIENG